MFRYQIEHSFQVYDMAYETNQYLTLSWLNHTFIIELWPTANDVIRTVYWDVFMETVLHDEKEREIRLLVIGSFC